MDAARFAVVYAAPEMAEGPAHLQPFCTTLAHHGLTPCSATVDGNLHLLRILRQVWQIVIPLSGPHPTARPQFVAKTSRCPAPRALFRHVMAIRDRAGSVHRQVQAWEAWAAPGTPGRTRTRFQRSQTGSEYVTRRLAQHVSLSRRSRDPKIHQRLRGIFRPTQTQVSATPRAGAVPSQRIFALVCAPLPTLKTNSFWPLFPF